MMKSLALLLVVLSSVLGVVLWRSAGDADDRGGSRSAVDPARVRAANGSPAARSDRSSPAPAPTASVTVPQLEPDRSLDETAADTVSAKRDRLHAEFAAQPFDPSWSSEATRQLTDDLGRFATADVRVQRIECRTTRCRVDLAPATPEAGERFVENWIRNRTWTGRGFATSEGETVVVFLDKPEPASGA